MLVNYIVESRPKDEQNSDCYYYFGESNNTKMRE
jgi:hypothetical protein